ncbi:MAG: putative 3-hydroxybutyryl-CoA dehydrogenase [Promethearchaeota archaeon]|jgi:enoyl-CoA hydratase/3-hydroxyacyl-CoA dehydrogenase|nr:MAG: putative 3-hydroxybutyryl-CoA dehydrogenase [Candidatus Lokiarchaeota archaeon]
MTHTDVKTISVIGAGTMGVGIAQIFLLSNAEKVNLIDISETTLKKARSTLKKYIHKLGSKNFFQRDGDAERIVNKLNSSTQLDRKVFNSDLIIEVIPEDIELKKNLLSKIGNQSGSNTIIASNTSTFTITELGEASNKPEKTIGMHFFVPPFMQSCIEVMKGEKTRDEVFHRTIEFCKTIPAKNGTMFVAPIQKDTPGFISNRLLIPGNLYLNILADKAAEKDIPIEQLDADAYPFMKVGPYELCDYLGLDTNYKALKSFEKRVSPEFAPGNVLTELVKNGYYGKKTGRGFYTYDEDGRPLIDKTKKAGLLDPELLLAIQLNESCKMLEENIVPNYSIIEKVMKIGIGTPAPFTPGKHNYKNWSDKLTIFAGENNKSYFEPCSLMKTGKFINMRI